MWRVFWIKARDTRAVAADSDQTAVIRQMTRQVPRTIDKQRRSVLFSSFAVFSALQTFCSFTYVIKWALLYY